MPIKVGQFTKDSSGNKVTQEINLGFKPKAIYFYGNNKTAEGVARQDFIGIWGVVDEKENQRGGSQYGDDGLGTSNNGQVLNSNNAFDLIDNTETHIAIGHVKLTPKGFNIIWHTNDTSAFLINYFAIGGDVETEVGTFELDVADGTSTVTVPTRLNLENQEPGKYLVMFLGNNPKADDVIEAEAEQIWGGVAKGSDDKDEHITGWAVTDNVGTTDTERAFIDNSSWCRWEAGTFRDSAGHVEGFTKHGMLFDIQNGLNSNQAQVTYLIIKGGYWYCDRHSSGSGGDGSQESITGLGFKPELACLSHVQSGSQTSSSRAKWSMGACDSELNQKSVGLDDRSNLSTTQITVRCDSYVLAECSANVASSSYRVDSMDEDGFTFTKEDEATANRAMVVICGRTDPVIEPSGRLNFDIETEIIELEIPLKRTEQNEVLVEIPLSETRNEEIPLLVPLQETNTVVHDLEIPLKETQQVEHELEIPLKETETETIQVEGKRSTKYFERLIKQLNSLIKD